MKEIVFKAKIVDLLLSNSIFLWGKWTIIMDTLKSMDLSNQFMMYIKK